MFKNIDDNDWVDNSTLKSIGDLHCLTFLEICKNKLDADDCDNISNEGIMQLKNLKLLRVLDCGYTKIAGKTIAELTSYLPNLRKLGLSSLNGGNNNGCVYDCDLEQISKCVPKLTHLDICNK